MWTWLGMFCLPKNIAPSMTFHKNNLFPDLSPTMKNYDMDDGD